jgi:hypothetical protein
VPVIEDKVRKHNNKFPDEKVLGVYKGVDVDDIKEYLLSDVKYKKIITTPEGFVDKVMFAFDDIEVMYREYFLLFDECERIITDVDYRGKIAAPVDEFFRFEKKSMVSATVLPFTDTRFKDFDHYIIEPTYDYSKPLTVIGTDSVISSVGKYVAEIKSDCICFFFNSTLGINSIIKSLKIESESKVFCAQDSVVKLLEEGYKGASSYFDVDELVKYNFFTSRYFSAVDMEVKFKPDIVMLTDVVFADHSILDPHTEIIQISGRFRKGNNSLTHITNFNPDIKSMAKEEAMSYLQGSFDTYEGFVKSHSKATNPGSMKTLEEAIKLSSVNAFYIDGKINTFMIDNFLHEERVKGYYQGFDKLRAAYQENEKHFKLDFKVNKCLLSDKDLLQLQARITKKEKNKIVIGLFQSWTPKDGEYVFPPEELREKLIAKYPELWEAHLHVKPEDIVGTDFVLGKIKRAVKKSKDLDLIQFVSKKVYSIFDGYHDYPESVLSAELRKIYKNEGLDSRVGAATIKVFFHGDRTMSNGEKIYRLKGKKFVDLENFETVEVQ